MSKFLNCFIASSAEYFAPYIARVLYFACFLFWASCNSLWDPWLTQRGENCTIQTECLPPPSPLTFTDFSTTARNNFHTCWAANPSEIWVAADQGVTKLDGAGGFSHLDSALSVQGVWGIDNNNVWAVGNSGTVGKWDGTSWIPQASGSGNTVWRVWGSKSIQVWAVGEPWAGTGPIPNNLWKWNGSMWSPYPSGVDSALYRIWGIDENNIWAAGSKGKIVKWDGAVWAVQPIDTVDDFYGIWPIDEKTIWAVTTNGVFWKWNSGTWSYSFAYGNGQVTFHGIWGANANNVWVVGTEGTVLQWDGVEWKKQNLGTTAFLTGVCGTSESDVWIVGTEGTIFHGQ